MGDNLLLNLSHCKISTLFQTSMSPPLIITYLPLVRKGYTSGKSLKITRSNDSLKTREVLIPICKYNSSYKLEVRLMCY